MSKPSARSKQANTAQPKKPLRGHGDINLESPLEPTKPHIPSQVKTEAARPVSAGSGRKRGDRRDTNPAYTGNERHSYRGNELRPDKGRR